MTIAQGTRRQRRSTAGANIPRYIAEWFAGERRVSMTAMAFPWYPLVPEYWVAWKAEHPGARPPAEFEWLDTPAALTRYPARLVAEARQCLAGPTTHDPT